jgi:hypothetical protein
MPIKQSVVAECHGKWSIGLFEAPCKAPLDFCMGFLCCGCTCYKTATQRLEIIDFVNEQYVCCGGIFPCGPLGEPCDPNCVWVEACCCNGCAISGNRFLMQTRFDLQNTCCDDCILWVTCIASWAICIMKFFMDVPDELEMLVDLLIQTVNGCMLAQQAYELKEQKKIAARDNNGIYKGIPDNVQRAIGATNIKVPPKQHSMAVGLATAIGGTAAGGLAANQVVKTNKVQVGQPQEAENQAFNKG